MQPAQRTLLRTLTLLRGAACAGQALAVALALWLLALPLSAAALWGGVLVLVAGTLLGWLQLARRRPVTRGQVLGWLAFDIAVLTWQLWWSGGMGNPFVSLYLVPIALAAVALPRSWTLGCALLCAAGYLLLATTAPALHLHHGSVGLLDLHLWGMAVNFLLTAALFVGLLARLVQTLRERDHELAQLRELQARNQVIVALGTQAAALAHALNTPLGTLKLLGDELRETSSPPPAALLDSLEQVVDLCRDRVRALVASADPAQQQPVRLEQWLDGVLERWLLLHPQIRLARQLDLAQSPLLQPDGRLTHLLHALLDNAAQASLANASEHVGLHAQVGNSCLRLQIRDHGRGMTSAQPSGRLFATTKADGLGLGLALSQATVEWLGGELLLKPAADGGTWTEATLPLGRLLVA